MSKLDTTVFDPGSNWGYTNSGYVLLALLIEQISGETYSNWMQKEILRPFGIKQAQINSFSDINSLNGHTSTGVMDSVSVLTYGGGGVFLTPRDFNSFGEHLIGNSLLDSLVRLSYQLSEPWIRDTTWRTGYGMWHGKDDLGPFIAHSGRSYGSQTYYRYYFESKLYIFYMTNQDSPNIKAFRESYLTLFIEED